MIRKFWIGFYAFALVVLVPVCVGAVWLTIDIFLAHPRSWHEWLWLPLFLFGPAWLLWVTWRLLRREVSRPG